MPKYFRGSKSFNDCIQSNSFLRIFLACQQNFMGITQVFIKSLTSKHKSCRISKRIQFRLLYFLWNQHLSLVREDDKWMDWWSNTTYANGIMSDRHLRVVFVCWMCSLSLGAFLQVFLGFSSSFFFVYAGWFNLLPFDAFQLSHFAWTRHASHGFVAFPPFSHFPLIPFSYFAFAFFHLHFI